MPIQSATFPTASPLLFLLFSKASQAGIDYEVRSQQRRNSRVPLVFRIKVGDLICWMCFLHHFSESSTPFWSEVKLSYPDTLFRLEIYFFETLRLLLTTFMELHRLMCFPKCTWPRGSQAVSLGMWVFSVREKALSLSSPSSYAPQKESYLGVQWVRKQALSPPFPSS